MTSALHTNREINFHHPQNMIAIHQGILGLNVCNSKNYMGVINAGVVSRIRRSTNHRQIYAPLSGPHYSRFMRVPSK